MIDAYIIDKLKREEEGEWQPVPLSIELPVNDDGEEREHTPQREAEPAITIRF